MRSCDGKETGQECSEGETYSKNGVNYYCDNGYWSDQKPTRIYGMENQSGISIYPNPANSFINIKTEKKIHSKYILFNILGEQVLSNFANQENNWIDISDLREGVFLLKIDNQNFKILKTK